MNVQMDRQVLTTRAVVSGLVIGVLVNVSNTYYGLRVGAASQMSMISALLGYIGFRMIPRISHLTPEENVLLVSVATATGCMPITAGLIQTIPALEFILEPNEKGPIQRTVGDLMIWSIGLSFFGIVFASLLRKQFVERETNLPWPGATATALLIRTLHSEKPISPEESRSSDEPETSHAERERNDRLWKNQLRCLLRGGIVSGIIV